MSKISRTEAVELINNTKGRIFTVQFTKKKGEERIMNCNKRTGGPTKLGYIPVNDLVNKGIRNVDPRTISKLVISGTTYEVK